MSNNNTRVEYRWTRASLDANDQTEYRFVHGGSQYLIHTELTEQADGSITLSVLSTGPEDREALAHIVNLLQSVVVQDSLEHQKELAQQEQAQQEPEEQ